jgi:catechol 2,3-dioxygenase-like lactoylglutathione lyase family enzyme
MPTFDAVGITAENLPATLRFYRLLGLEFEAFGEGHHEATMANGFRLMIDDVPTVESFSTHEPATGGRNVALAFGCDSPAEVDAMHAAVIAGGFVSRESPFDAPWGQRYASVLDPDANPVDLYAPVGDD